MHVYFILYVDIFIRNNNNNFELNSVSKRAQYKDFSHQFIFLTDDGNIKAMKQLIFSLKLSLYSKFQISMRYFQTNKY